MAVVQARGTGALALEALLPRLRSGGATVELRGRHLVASWLNPRTALDAVAHLLGEDGHAGLAVGLDSLPWPEGRVEQGPEALRALALCRAASPGHAVVSESAWLLSGAEPPENIAATVADHVIGQLAEPERVVIMRGLETAELPLRTVETVANNLPGQAMPLVGRRAELEGFISDPDWQVAVLTGAPGIGKTRLALRTAAELLPELPGGAWLVDTGAAEDKRDLVRMMAATVIRPGREVESVGELAGLLADQPALVVLDRCEHLIDSAVEVVDALVRRGACVRVLLTSRTRPTRKLSAGTRYRELMLGPLAVPPDGPLSAAQAARCESVELFVDLARRSTPPFRVDESNVDDVARLSRRLGGVPLAIEMVAAHTSAITPGRLLAEMDGILGSTPSGPERDDLIEIIDWSYRLLGWPEREAYHALSVFAGG
ncbi:MAG TPA: hypothetical protein VGR90_06060, partial [Acidimicrobiales bacterium]|nr:hypothetical protein [Acidimicrobiales bacterium]